MRRILFGLLLALALAGCRQEEYGSTAENVTTNVATTERPATAAPGATPAATNGFWDTATATTAVTPADGPFWPTASPTTVTVSATPPVATPPVTTATTPAEIAAMPSPALPVTCSTPAGWVGQPIRPGDTVGALAACAGAPVGEVLAANCLPPNGLIFAGQELSLPAACAPPAACCPTPSASRGWGAFYGPAASTSCPSCGTSSAAT